MTELAADTAQRVKEMRGNLVPDGPAPTGHRLTVTGQNPFEYAWRQPEDEEILHGHGDPNGNVTAQKGIGLYVDIDAPALWQNNDGESGWTEIGSSGASGFPVGPEDDGTGTAEIAHIDLGGGVDLLLTSLVDDGGTNKAQTVYATQSDDAAVQNSATTGSNETASTSDEVSSTGAVSALNTVFGSGNTAEVRARSSSGGTSSVDLTADQIVVSGVSNSPGFGINVGTALPTSDPGVAGQLWMDPVTFVVMVGQ